MITVANKGGPMQQPLQKVNLYRKTKRKGQQQDDYCLVPVNEKISECKRLRINCSCPEACPRLAFRNNHKIQFHWPNNHNEPTDGVKLELMDKIMKAPSHR